jgi:hypothetical protein
MCGRSGFRPPRRARPFSNFSQDGGCGIAGHDRNGDDAAAGGFHFLATNDLIAGPIATLYEHIREKRGNQFARRWGIENHHGVYTLQRREDFRSLAFGDDRAAFAFQLADTSVTVEPDDERVTQFARLLQAANVTGMKKVEAALGENNAATVAILAAESQNRFLKRKN